MSISNDSEERNSTSSRQSKISYTREYLLSFSELEICRKLPEGIDKVLLISLTEQGFRHNDYGSSPPGKEETGMISRGFQRWDNSHGKWRTDSDSQSDRDSDSGRRYGNLFRRSGQNPEHDGLLGSGSIPKPPGYRPGSSAPPSGATDQRQMNRTSDPYHPPRPYKAGPHSWRETKDSYNDETFGSVDGTGEDRVEEERKRRAEFEMMRKEQHKEYQEKLKSKAMKKLKDDPLTELAASLDAGDNAKMTIGLDTSLVKPIQQNDSSKVSISSQGHLYRPPVPPGFANAATEKMSGPKSLGNFLLQVGYFETGDDNQEKKSALQPSLDTNHSEIAFLWASKGGTEVDITSALDLSSKVEDPEDQSLGVSKFSGIGEIIGNDKVIGFSPENESGHKIVGKGGHSTSKFGNLLGGSLNKKSTGPSNIIEDHNMKGDIDLSPKDIHSSKFAQWFLEEETKPVESRSSEKPNSLLSLIVGEMSGSTASDTKTTKKILPPESNLMEMGTLPPSDAGVSDSLYKNKPERNSAVLTCEDLEKSIISDFGGSSSSSQPPGIICSQHDLENEIPTAKINNNASQHLLSLLQKGNSSNSKTASPISILDKGSPIDSLKSGSERKIQGHTKDLDAENLSSGKGLTLETLFGSAFMNELHSFDAPISAQRNYVPEPSMMPVVDSADGAVNTSVSEARFKRVNKDNGILGLGGAHQSNLEKVGMNWLTADMNDRSQTEIESSNLQRFNLHLAEQETLNSLGRQDSSPFSRGPFDMLKPEMPYPNMHAQSSPQFNPTLVNHGRPRFPPLDPHVAHMNPHFMPLEGINRQDPAIHHQISANLGHAPFRHPNSGLSQFDRPIHPMLQQIHMPNILPPAPFLPGSSPPGYVQDHNMPHGFPFGQQHPNPVDLRVPLQGREHGGVDNNPPQVFQRLLELELRSNPKPMHPSFPAVGGHSQPMYGHELDTGFWRR